MALLSPRKRVKLPLVLSGKRMGLEMSDYMTSGVEPSLEDLIHDPMIKQLMESDGVEEAKLLPLLEYAAHALHQRQGLHG
jgi:hypothetical protein